MAAAFDVLAARPEVDEDRLGLIGRSFGGYYATRAAAFEKRVKGLVVFGALFEAVDLYDDYPTIRFQLQWLTGGTSPEETRERLKNFSLKSMTKELEKILDKRVPELPTEVKLQLPKLQKVGSTQPSKIKLPKLKKV